VTANAGIPATRLNILGQRPLLQQQLATAVEKHHVSHPVNQARIAVTTAAGSLADDVVVLIDEIKLFGFYGYGRQCLSPDQKKDFCC
jgi:hypothetical protein